MNGLIYFLGCFTLVVIVASTIAGLVYKAYKRVKKWVISVSEEETRRIAREEAGARFDRSRNIQFMEDNREKIALIIEEWPHVRKTKKRTK